MEKIANFVYDRARLVILVYILLTVISLASFYRAELDTNFLSFFAGGNPKAEEFNQLNEKYQSGESISILVEQDGLLLDKENLLRVFTVQEQVRAIDGISRVQSYLPPQIIMQGEIIPVDEQFITSNYEVLSDFISNRYFLKDQFLSPDGHKGIIVASLQLNAAARQVVDSLKDIVQSEDQLTLSLAGNEVIKDTLWGYLIRVLAMMPAAVLLILLVFFVFIRNRLLTILAWVPAALAALWTFGTVFWSGHGLDIVTVLSPLFIIVIGSAFGLHYVSHFKENLHRYSDRRLMTVETMRMVGLPIFLAAITTMAGFVSLTWANVIPMREMGIFVTLGVGYAALVALLFLPAVLSVIRLPSNVPEPGKNRVAAVVLSASRMKAPIIIVFVAIVVVSAIFIPRLEVVSDLLMFFKEGTTIRENFAKVEESFGGALPLIGEIVSPEGSAALNDYEFAGRVLATERELEGQPGIKSAFSIFDVIKGANKMITGQDVYPQDKQIILGALMLVGNTGTWLSGDGMLLTVRTQGFESQDVAGLEEFIDNHNDVIPVITGMPLLFDEMNRLVVQSQIRSLGLAFILIFAMLLIVLRKLRAALVGMLPVAITIIAILGIVSIAKFNLNILTANLSAICIGVGVDYSIHLISGIHYFRKRGQDHRQSVDSALSSVSRPVLANALGLAIGLSVLFFSPLRIHFHAASIMWVAMIVSSMAALLLIPIFYTWGKEIKDGTES